MPNLPTTAVALGCATLSLLLSACGTSYSNTIPAIYTKEITLDSDTPRIDLRVSKRWKNNWLTQASYSQARGNARITLQGGENSAYETRLQHKNTTFTGPQQIDVDSNLHQANISLLLPIVDIKWFRFHAGAAAIHSYIDNRYNSSKRYFDQSEEYSALSTTALVSLPLGKRFSLESRAQRILKGDLTYDFSYYARAKLTQSLVLDIGRYRYIPVYVENAKMSLEEKYCKPESDCSFSDTPYRNENSPLHQSFRGYAIGITYNI